MFKNKVNNLRVYQKWVNIYIFLRDTIKVYICRHSTSWNFKYHDWFLGLLVWVYYRGSLWNKTVKTHGRACISVIFDNNIAKIPQLFVLFSVELEIDCKNDNIQNIIMCCVWYVGAQPEIYKLFCFTTITSYWETLSTSFSTKIYLSDLSLFIAAVK